MNLAREIKKDIYWIGVNDRRTHIFENYWPLPKGVAYNSYIIVDEKVVVIDTIERSKMDDYVENIEQLLNGRKVDYLVINHMEPDHTGAIKALLCHYPDVKIIGNAKTFPMLKNFYGVCENLMEIKEGDSLDLGKHKLNFYMAPMLHWPETMVTFESTEGILFSGDIFGAFGTLDGGIFDDEVDLDYLEEKTRWPSDPDDMCNPRTDPSFSHCRHRDQIRQMEQVRHGQRSRDRVQLHVREHGENGRHHRPFLS